MDRRLHPEGLCRAAGVAVAELTAGKFKHTHKKSSRLNRGSVALVLDELELNMSEGFR